MTAASSKQVEIVRILLGSGAKVNARDAYGMTSLFYAVGDGGVAQKSSSEILDLLVKSGADQNIVDSIGTTPLIVSCRNGDLSGTRCLIANGANVNTVDPNGRNASFYIWQRTQTAPLQLDLLLSNGMEVNARDHFEDTVLLNAVRHDRPDLIKVLIVHGVDVNARNRNVKTALALAIAFKHNRTAKLLREHGAHE